MNTYLRNIILMFLLCNIFTGCAGCGNETVITTSIPEYNDSPNTNNVSPDQNKPISPKLTINKSSITGREQFSVTISDEQPERYTSSALRLKITFIEGYFDDLKGAIKHKKLDPTKPLLSYTADYFEVAVNMNKQPTQAYDLSVKSAPQDKKAKIKIELYYYNNLKDTATLDWQQGIGLALKDIRYDEKTGKVLGTIVNTGTKSAKNVKVKCKNKTPHTLQWNSTSLGNNQEVEVSVVNEIAAGSTMTNHGLGQLDFKGTSTANLEFTLSYEGGTSEPQTYPVYAKDIKLDLQISHDNKTGIVTCILENKGTSEVRNPVLTYKNTTGNGVTLNNSSSGTVNLNNFSKSISHELPIKFGKAKNASFEFTITYDGMPAELKKEKYFIAPSIEVYFLTYISENLVGPVIEVVELEDSKEEEKIARLKIIAGGFLEEDQLEIKITPLIDSQKGFLSTSKNGPKITRLVGGVDFNNCKENHVCLYFCPQGETKLEFKIEVFYKGELIHRHGNDKSPFFKVKWEYKPTKFIVVDDNRWGGWQQTQGSNKLYKSFDIKSDSWDSLIDWKQVEIKLEPISGTKGLLSIKSTGPPITSFNMDQAKYGSAFVTTDHSSHIRLYLSSKKEEELSFELHLSYKGKHMGNWLFKYTAKDIKASPF